MPVRMLVPCTVAVLATFALGAGAGAQTPAALPPVEPLDTRDLSPRGNGVGCDLEAVDFGELFLRARCNEFTTPPASGLSARLRTAVNMSFVYDGMYICALVNADLAQRVDAFGEPLHIRVSTYFHELNRPADGSVTYIPRDTGLNATRRGLDYRIPVTAFAPRPDQTVPCVVLPYAQGVTSGDQPRLPDDRWVPTTQADIFLGLPPLAPLVVSPFSPGDSIAIAEIGLRVAGRRLPGQ